MIAGSESSRCVRREQERITKPVAGRNRGQPGEHRQGIHARECTVCDSGGSGEGSGVRVIGPRRVTRAEGSGLAVKLDKGAAALAVYAFR